jgi:thioesterase domain-containing protein
VEIQPHGSRVPMFWLHTLGGGGGGGLFAYRKVAELLGPEQPSYGLVTPPEPFARIEDMAAHYIREIRTLQPDGPYHLGGYCFGGVVAFEMARQLEQQGLRVGLLAAIELPPPHGYKKGGVDVQLIRNFFRTLPTWTKYFFAQGRKEVGARIRQKARNLLRKIKRRYGGAPDRDAVAEIQARLEEFIDFAHYPEDFKRYARTHWEALERYCPKTYPGRIALFRTHRPHLFELEPERYWMNLAAAVDVSLIPGTHEQVLDEPHVQSLAANLRAWLEKAQSRTNN